jgi:hypothetical protein
MENGALLGGCLCGSVRYEITASLQQAEHCHCSMCRKASGATFSTNSVMPTNSLRVTAGADFVSEYESSPKRRRCFCSNCGSPLFIRRIDMPEITVVTLGTVDADPHTRPERHVFVAWKAPWYEITDELPQFKIYPGFEPNDGTPSAVGR